MVSPLFLAVRVVHPRGFLPSGMIAKGGRNLKKVNSMGALWSFIWPITITIGAVFGGVFLATNRDRVNRSEEESEHRVREYRLRTSARPG